MCERERECIAGNLGCLARRGGYQGYVVLTSIIIIVIVLQIQTVYWLITIGLKIFEVMTFLWFSRSGSK